MAEVSVMKVFLSGVLPGLIIVIFFSIYISIMGKKVIPDQKLQRPDVLKMAQSLKKWMDTPLVCRSSFLAEFMGESLR